ncbi:unnamed protein product, partial [Rotaria sp. Silwood1]
MKLKSDAKLHPTACIVLDVILALESVQCRFGVSQELELTFNSASNAAFIYKHWVVSAATFVTGGLEWGCLNETTQQPMLIIQRLTSLQLKNERIIIKTWKDTHLSPLVCFANITMSLTVEQHGSKTTATSRNKRATFAVPEPRLFTDSKYITPLEPHGNEIFYPGQTINIRWSYSDVDGTNDLKIVLNRKRLAWDAEVSTLNTRINVQHISFTIPASLETSSNDQYYFEFSFRRKLVFYERESAIFYIPTRPSIIPRSPPDVNDVYYPGDVVPIAWESANFDATSKITVRFRRARLSIITDATLDTFTVIATAGTLCPTREPKLYYVCRMCAEGRSMGIQLTCINCWTTYDYSLVQMDLVRRDNSLTLDYLTVRIYSSISVNIDLDISANYPYVFSGTLPLPSIPIIKPIPFTIANIQFDVGMSFAPSIPWYIEVNTIGNLTGGVDYKLQTNLTLTTFGGNTTRNFDQVLIRNNHPIQGDFQANIKVDLALRPALQLDVGIFTLEIATEGYVIFEDIWHYPPFDALSTSIFDWNKQKPADFHLSIPSNACTLPHFIRYHVTFGIRNTKVTFYVTIGSSLVPFLNGYTLSYSTSSLLDLGPYELASGYTTDEYLSKSVLFDLAYALNVSKTRLYYNSAYGVQQDQMTGVMITLLPSASAYTTDATVSKLIEILQIQAMNTSSALYSGIIMSLLNRQQTLSANNLGLSTTTSS